MNIKTTDTTEKQATLATWLTNNIDWQRVTPEKLAHSLLARFYVADKPPTNAALVAALEALVEEAEYWSGHSEDEGRSDHKENQALLDRCRAALAAARAPQVP